LGVEANAFECVGRCIDSSFLSLYLLLCRSLSHLFSRLLVAHPCHFCSHVLAPSSVCLLVVLSPSRSLSSVTLFSSFLAVARVLALDFFLSLSVSLSLHYPFSLSRSSHSVSLCLSLTLSLSFVLALSLAFFLFFFSISLCLSLARGRALFFRICRGRPLHGLQKLCSGARKVFAIGLLSLILRTVSFRFLVFGLSCWHTASKSMKLETQ